MFNLWKFENPIFKNNCRNQKVTNKRKKIFFSWADLPIIDSSSMMCWCGITPIAWLILVRTMRLQGWGLNLHLSFVLLVGILHLQKFTNLWRGGYRSGEGAWLCELLRQLVGSSNPNWTPFSSGSSWLPWWLGLRLSLKLTNTKKIKKNNLRVI
jgi:hypothetical protein